MSTHHTTRAHTAAARFKVTAWDEKVLVDVDGEGTDINGVTYPKRGFSQVTASYSYSGDLEGTALVGYLISYRKTAAPVSGFERFEGSLDGHDGSFVMQHTGDQDADGVRATLQVVEGMGTGGLGSITGEASVEIAGHSDDGYAITLTYDL